MAKVQMVIFEDANGNLFYSRAEKLEEQHKIENELGLTKIAIIAGNESWQIQSVTELRKSWNRKHEELVELHDDIERERALFVDHVTSDGEGKESEIEAPPRQSQHEENKWDNFALIDGQRIGYNIFDLPGGSIYILVTDEESLEHIIKMLNEGYVEGELNVCMDDKEYRGYWKLLKDGE